jgi:hypothetical protein
LSPVSGARITVRSRGRPGPRQGIGTEICVQIHRGGRVSLVHAASLGGTRWSPDASLTIEIELPGSPLAQVDA